MKSLCILWLNVGLVLAAEPVRITTSQYDNSRTGADLSETVLTPKNVNVRQFGKLISLPVDGDVYAQPLYLPDVEIPGKGRHNLLFVATEHDSVYAFDADKMSTSPVWHVNFLPSTGIVTTVPDRDAQCPFISPEIGITSTPAIDIETGTLYVLARTKAWKGQSSAEYRQQLHALAITTGAEKFAGPVTISATSPGRSHESDGSVVKFNPLRENPRSSLLLANGSVYLSWASSCDVGPYHGWVMSYDARTLRQQAVLNTSPDSSESGIWQSDTGPAADEEGNVYVVTGNGEFDAGPGKGHDYGDTVLKLKSTGNQLIVADFFTPFDQQQLNASDNDLGSGGPVLLPGPSGAKPSALVFGGKAGVLYAANPEHLGGKEAGSADPAIERFHLSNGILSAPAYWNGHLYYYTSNDSLKDFLVRGARVSRTPAFRSSRTSEFSGGTPTVSANRTRDAIVWLIETKAWNAFDDPRPAVLRAYDALNVGRELWASDQDPGRDRAGQALRFTIPTVASGRVYVGVRKAVDVYGLLPH